MDNFKDTSDTPLVKVNNEAFIPVIKVCFSQEKVKLTAKLEPLFKKETENEDSY